MDASRCVNNVTACVSMLAELQATVASMNETIQGLQEGAYPCVPEEISYDFGLHLGAIFAVLVASVAGVFSTLVGKHWSVLRLHPYIVMVGKTAGTGVVLACGFVHMLQPANASLTSDCITPQFNNSYPAYAYLFAVLTAIGMQNLEYVISRMVPSAHACSHSAPPTTSARSIEEVLAAATQGKPECSQSLADVEKGGGGGSNDALISAILAEFAFSVHSVFIGLAVGMAGDADLKVLLVALCFHQFFEGVSLGARLSEATLSGKADFAMALLFAVSAPIGIAVVVGVVHGSGGVVDTSGATFLITQGVFDGVCAVRAPAQRPPKVWLYRFFISRAH